MLMPNIQYTQRVDLHSRNHVVGYPNFPFGFTDWTSFTRCNEKGIVARSIQFGHLPKSSPHLAADRFYNTAQHSPVEDPPNQPKKPPIKEPGKIPERPPLPGEAPVEEPPNEPGKPPVKEPPPKDLKNSDV